MKTRINVEEVEALLAQRRAWNALNFDDIEWHVGGKPVSVPASVADEFRFTGLANTDFVGCGFIDYEEVSK